MQGFKPVSIDGGGNPSETWWVIGNSERISTGTHVKVGATAGGIDEYDNQAETTSLGVCVGIYGFDGTKTVPLSSASTGDFGHTLNANTPIEQDVTASATNESRANQIVALIVHPTGVKFSGYLDAAAATTANSNVAGIFLATVSTTALTHQLDESTASATITNTDWVLVPSARDPSLATDDEANDSRRMYCRLLRQSALTV